MKILSKADNLVTAELSSQDLLAITNSLNEVCNGIDIRAFETRLGCSKEYIQNLLEQFRALVS